MSYTRPYLLSLYSETPNCKKHFNSVSKLNCEHIRVRFDSYPGHREKWFHVPENLDKDRHVIFLDTDDVLVQKDLPQLTEDLYLGNENVKHKDTIWKQVLEETNNTHLMEETVYNVGCFAAKVPVLYEFISFLKSQPPHPLADQLCFNLFIKKNIHLGKVDSLKYFCPLFANVHRGAVKDNGWRIDGELVSIAHANGDKALKEKLW